MNQKTFESWTVVETRLSGEFSKRTRLEELLYANKIVLETYNSVLYLVVKNNYQSSVENNTDWMTNCKIWVTIRNYNNVHSDVVQTLFTSGNWSKNPQKIFSIWGEMSNVLKIYILILLTSKTCSVSCCKCVFKLAWLVDGCTGWCCVKSTGRGTPTIIYWFSPTNSLDSTPGHQLQNEIEWSPRY